MFNLRPTVIVIILALLPLSACLKTRAQIRNQQNTSDASEGVNTKVTPINNDSQMVDELRGEVQRLNSRIEELELANKNSSEVLEKKYSNKVEETKKIEERLQELEKAQTQLIEALKKQEQDRPSKIDPALIFEQAKQNFKNKTYPEAIDLFGQYIKSPKVKNLDDALFYRGEALFISKQYKKAILDFSTLHEKHSKSKHIPHSLLRIAQCFEFLGMKSDAQVFYQELVDKHPKSNESKTAAKKLK